MILHIDMDAFYASVEQLDNPEFKGKCVIVGGQSGRSVVSAASYEARKFGVHSAMPVFQARQKCPQGIFVSPRMNRYKQISQIIMGLLHEFTPKVEVVSIDEAYMDISGSNRLHGSPEAIGRQIKRRIKKKVSLTCSVGIAPVKFLAKVASDMNKPDGLTIIQEKEVQSFIKYLPIHKVPGVGKKTGAELEAMGIKTLGDIRNYSEDILVKKLGKYGRKLKGLSVGHDNASVTLNLPQKSISSEKTLSEDTKDFQFIKKILLDQADTVARGLRKDGVRAKTITLKIKYADFKLVTKSNTLASPTQSSETIYGEAEKLLYTLKPIKKIRLVGVGASGFISADVPVQKSLFNKKSESADIWNAVDKTIDSIKERYGNDVITRATLKNE